MKFSGSPVCNKPLFPSVVIHVRLGDPDTILANVQKISMSLYTIINPIVDEIKKVIDYVRSIGVSRQIQFRPLMDSKSFTESGIWFQLVRPSKRSELIAAGGR